MKEYKPCSDDLDTTIYFFSVISQDYYELPKRTIRDKVNRYHIFKPNNYRDVENLYQDKASIDITLNELKYLTSSTCWKKAISLFPMI